MISGRLLSDNVAAVVIGMILSDEVRLKKGESTQVLSPFFVMQKLKALLEFLRTVWTVSKRLNISCRVADVDLTRSTDT